MEWVKNGQSEIYIYMDIFNRLIIESRPSVYMVLSFTSSEIHRCTSILFCVRYQKTQKKFIKQLIFAKIVNNLKFLYLYSFFFFLI